MMRCVSPDADEHKVIKKVIHQNDEHKVIKLYEQTSANSVQQCLIIS